MIKNKATIYVLIALMGAVYTGYQFITSVSHESAARSIYEFDTNRPMYIAHRNQALVYPDHSRAAVRESAASSLVDALEVDVRKLSDGTLVNFHDHKLKRLTGHIGKVEDLTTAEFHALRINPKKWNKPRILEDDIPTTYEDILSEYKGKKIFVPEVKTKGAGAVVVNALVEQGIPTTEAIVQSFFLDDLLPAVRAGYPAMLLTDNIRDIALAKTEGVTWVGIKQNAPDVVFKSWHDAGFKTVAWTVNNLTRRDELLSLGVIGFFTDDVTYLSTGKQGS